MFAGESEKKGSRGFWMDEDEIQLFAQAVESESDRRRFKLGARRWVLADVCVEGSFTVFCTSLCLCL